VNQERFDISAATGKMRIGHVHAVVSRSASAFSDQNTCMKKMLLTCFAGEGFPVKSVGCLGFRV
jgi:hypothetical protein